MRPTADLRAELVATRRTSTRINVALWLIAAGVMVYGAGYVTELLLAHGAPPLTAWVLSFMVDAALCVALLADRNLSRHGRKGWRLTGLRWTCAVMTWALNVAGAVWPAHGGAVDWVGVGTRSCGPVLLVVVAGAAAWVQQQLAEITAELADSIKADVAAADAAAEHAAAVDAAWDAAFKEDRKRAAAGPQTTPQRTPQPAAGPRRTTGRKPAARPDRAAVLAAMVETARTNPDTLPTAATLAADTGWSKRWAENVLADARREARTPHLVQAVR